MAGDGDATPYLRPAREEFRRNIQFESKDRIGGVRLSSYRDGTQTRKGADMREIIRFARGTSSLGDFVVVMSDKGLVALMFSSHRAATEDALRDRFPDADVVEGQADLADVLERVSRAIEQPGVDPDLPLDLRGTPYEIKVWTMLRSIPAGETTSYGALAAELNTRDARDVTEAIASNPIAVLVPCHRVIKKDGSISGYRWGVRRKRALLAREQKAESFRLE